VILYELVDGGVGVLTAWLTLPPPTGLESKQRHLLIEKLDRIQQAKTHAETRPYIFPAKYRRKVVRDIFKTKVNSNVQLRPLLCYGLNPGEVTFLVTAIEVGWEWLPDAAPITAQRLHNDLRAGRAKRIPFAVPKRGGA
jgi:hypothetical protein